MMLLKREIIIVVSQFKQQNNWDVKGGGKWLYKLFDLKSFCSRWVYKWKIFNGESTSLLEMLTCYDR